MDKIGLVADGHDENRLLANVSKILPCVLEESLKTNYGSFSLTEIKPSRCSQSITFSQCMSKGT